MIRFNCNCTHEFLVPEDQAGGLVQCPKCSKLNDVPLLSDLANLDADGSYKMDARPPAPPTDQIPLAARAFTRDLRDHRGQEIDMRADVEEFLNIGADAVPLELADEERPGAPKYDPLTGELIETIAIKETDKPIDARSIPMAKAAIGYATPDLDRRVTPGRILLELFQPINLFVLLCVLFAHVLLQITFTLTEGGLFFIVPVLLLLAGMILAHYGVVVEEIGNTQLDELPRPLRNASFSEDIWNPMIRFIFALMLCFWPALFFLKANGPAEVAMVVTACLFGLYFFPAVLVTSLTAGSYLNLRLDRLIGVIRICGLAYWVSVFGFAITAIIYISAILGIDYSTSLLFRGVPVRVPLIGLGIGTPTLIVGVYLMHFACWHLGIIYRANHDRFPWILQRHIRTRRTDTLAQLEAARRNAQRLDMLRANRQNRDERLTEIREAEKTRRQGGDEKPIWDRVAETRDE